MSERRVCVRVNGVDHARSVDVRRTLADFLREDLRLTGTHLGCEHGVCGACTVVLDGDPVHSCLMFAVQADGADILTVEGLAAGEALHPLQKAFCENHAIQCGFCTPGFLTTLSWFLARSPTPTGAEIRETLSGNLCRCTGYINIERAVKAVIASPRAGTSRSRATEP